MDDGYHERIMSVENMERIQCIYEYRIGIRISLIRNNLFHRYKSEYSQKEKN